MADRCGDVSAAGALLPVAVIGAGAIGQRHVEVVQACPATRLTAVVEPDATLRTRLAEDGLPMVADIEDIPGETRAAIVATPTPAHSAPALACLARGWPVIVEKPLAATLGEARALARAFAEKGVPLFTGHHRRCHPFSQAARRALAEIGALVGLSGIWSLRKHDSYYDPPWRRAPGAGPLMTNLSHEIDLLRYLVGELAEVTALTSHSSRGLAIEDSAALALRFENGALGAFLISDAGASPWSFEAASAENPAIAASGRDYIRFAGTTGALEFPSLTRWAATHEGEVEWSMPLSHLPAPAFPRVDPLLEQARRFAEVVTGGDDDVLCTAEDGIAALAGTLATALSARRGAPMTPGDVPQDFNGT